MDNLIYDSGASVQRLIAQGFQMPIHFVAVGTNGAVVAEPLKPRCTDRIRTVTSPFRCQTRTGSRDPSTSCT